jgi:hypothetical protein
VKPLVGEGKGVVDAETQHTYPYKGLMRLSASACVPEARVDRGRRRQMEKKRKRTSGMSPEEDT